MNEMSQMLFLDKLIHKNYEEIRESPDLVHVDTRVINSCFNAIHVFVPNPCPN